jgi:hypothetical protein
MDVAAARVQVDDRVTNELAGPVVGDVAAAARLVDLDPARSKHVRARQNVSASAVAAHAEGQDVGMFEQEQRIADDAGSAIFHQGSLQGECLSVGDAAQASHVEWACRLPVPPVLPLQPFLPS